MSSLPPADRPRPRSTDDQDVPSSTSGYLLTGGTVVTMVPGDEPRTADVLVRGGAIVAIGADLDERPELRDAVLQAQRLDVSGSIVAPGFVDTHRHAWEAQFRRSIPDVDDLAGYVQTTLVGLAPQYSPEDMYVGTRLAALSALDAGITTMLDFSHNSRSAAHSNRAIEAQLDVGLRVVHASMSPHFGEWDHQWPADLGRLIDTYGSDLMSFRVAALPTDEISGPPLVYGSELAAVARDLGVGVSIDAVFGDSSSRALVEWGTAGLLGPEVELIHCTNLSDDAWMAIGDTGATVALAPTSDAQIGTETAVPAIDESLAHGVRPGLSVDVEVTLSSDMFTQMRALLSIQRMRAVESGFDTGETPQRLHTWDVLDFATAQGARTIGLENVTGRLSPGMAADLTVIDADAVNTMPLNDAVGTVVLGADARNIRTVFVAGEIKKWNGRLVGVDVGALHEQVLRSRDDISRRVGARAENGDEG